MPDHKDPVTTRALIEAKRYRLELILIGMALASKPIQDKITAAVDPQRLVRPTSQACLSAIAGRDREAVHDWAAQIGAVAKEGETMVDAVIAAVIEMDGRDRLAGVLAELTTYNHGGSIEAIRSTAEDLNELLITMD